MDSFSLSVEYVDNDCKKGVIDLKSEIEKEVTRKREREIAYEKREGVRRKRF